MKWQDEEGPDGVYIEDHNERVVIFEPVFGESINISRKHAQWVYEALGRWLATPVRPTEKIPLDYDKDLPI